MSDPNMRGAEALSEALKSASQEQLDWHAKQWIPLVRGILGLRRMGKTRWGSILEVGVRGELFTQEGDLYEGKLISVDPAQKRFVSPMAYLDCGHWNYQQVPVGKNTPKKHTGGSVVVKTKVLLIEHPKDCPACKSGKIGNPRYQRGKYRKPVPENLQRTPFKHEYPGFPGLCTDPETGMYIGGVGNDCRFSPDNGGARCICHSK